MTGPALIVLARDAAGVLAVASISIGAGMIYLPAGFIVGGTIVLAGVVMAAR
ncbi:Hypothetical protein NGAL_HAMBI2605_09540 [Neorhizobium galegae bv. orientalis]|nr:Hypothetical protein NGAL_HAMBI2605_09540 [Neorhizobium galegae bv. orientalis]